jgi:hypothetical protein
MTTLRRKGEKVSKLVPVDSLAINFQNIRGIVSRLFKCSIAPYTCTLKEVKSFMYKCLETY